MTQVFIDCMLEVHGPEILEILNEAIANSTAIWESEPRTLDAMTSWFATKSAGNFPVVGIVDASNDLIAFGTYGAFRNWPGYKFTVEHSVYVRHDKRGQGLGKLIMNELISRAKNQGMHSMIGGIDATNKGSIALHTNLGFVHVGTLPEVGYKFDRWLDLAFFQLVLD